MEYEVSILIYVTSYVVLCSYDFMIRYNVNDTVVRTSEGANVFLPAGTP